MTRLFALLLACLVAGVSCALAQDGSTRPAQAQGSGTSPAQAPDSNTSPALAPDSNIRPAQAPDSGVDVLLHRLEETLNAGDQAGFRALFYSVPAVLVDRYISDLFMPGAVKSAVRERDRTDLEGAPPGDGNRLVVEIFVETAGRARILTAGLDVRRPPGGDAASWRIVRAEGLTAVEGLYRLRLNTATPYIAHNLEVTSEDVQFSLPDGHVFLVECDDGITGLVMLGRGDMRFTPAPAAERGQLRIFSGAETLVAAFDSVFIRLNPADYTRRVSAAALTVGTADDRQARRAQEVFARESLKSLTLDLSDLSREIWHLLPPADDFLAEVQSRKYGALTFMRSSSQAEDVSLFQRDRKRTIALYPSKAKIAARGRFYSDDVLREYDVLDYNIDAALNPQRQFVQGRARLAIRARTSLSTLTLRLAETLVVTNITSVEYGRLLFLKVRNQNTVLVNLPTVLPQDADITLFITYSGRVAGQELDSETIQVGAEPAPPSQGDFPMIAMEPNFLLSNRAYWYPQNPVPDYATATLRLTVPEGYTCIASGEPEPADAVVSLKDLLTIPDGDTFTFRAGQPLRYLAVVVSHFTRVAEKTITVGGDPDSPGDRVAIRVEANPRQQARGRALVKPVEDVLRFYTGLLGDAPFPSATVAFVESALPGGHSPGYFAVLNDPAPGTTINWRTDPASFDGFPEFFLAHELAHQWWGQAIGWKNYHEQWISEGFAQYFAALYAQQARGERVFTDMLKQFRRWSLADSDQGPVSLGYRLGHIKSEPRVFRALVYNKGAAVLHMLRRLLGDDVFFSALRRFYQDRKFQKAGTDDLQRAFEAASGRNLDRFFERWIYGTDLPHIAYRTAITSSGVTVHFEQTTELLFDLPVTVTLAYADGRSSEVVVPISEKVTDQLIPVSGQVRQVQINRDSAAVAEFDEL
jgi:hypothetical protein